MSDSQPIEILMVEDNPGDVRLTREALRDGKVRNTLHVVEDGERALDSPASAPGGGGLQARTLAVWVPLLAPCASSLRRAGAWPWSTRTPGSTG